MNKTNYLKIKIKSKIRAGTHALDSIIMNRLGMIPEPRAAHFMVTWRCNLRCSACSIWKKKDSPELSTGEIIKLIGKLKFLDIIKILGGEPFLRDDIKDIVIAIQKIINPYILQLVTNGTLTEKIVETVTETGASNLHLRISLDGLRDSHDKARGVSGTFKMVEDTVAALAPLQKKIGFKLGINFSVTDNSINEIRQFKEWCRERNVEFIPGIPIKPFLSDDYVWDDKNTAPAGHPLIQKNLHEVKRFFETHGFESNLSYKYLERKILGKLNKLTFHNTLNTRTPHYFRCLELKSLLYILPDASLVTCGLRQEVIANLLESKFSSVWKGERIKTFRYRVKQCPGCFQNAVEILSRLYYGSIR